MAKDDFGVTNPNIKYSAYSKKNRPADIMEDSPDTELGIGGQHI
jgi:hypothetical protein